MANTVSVLSYQNTFGDLVTQQNSVATELNSLGAGAYTKTAGPLVIASTGTGLQVNDTAIIGTGVINNTLTVLGDLIVQANLRALGLGTSVIIANTAAANSVLCNVQIRTSNLISTNTSTLNVVTANILTVGVLNSDYVNSAFTLANSTSVTAVAASLSAGLAFNRANTAFDKANTGFASTGGTITGNVTISSGGSFGLSIRNADVTGNGYGGVWSMFNTSALATNKNKTFRISPTGAYEIMNNSNTTSIFILSDDGSLSVTKGIVSNNISASFLGVSSALAAKYISLEGNCFWANTQVSTLNNGECQIGYRLSSSRYIYFAGQAATGIVSLYDTEKNVVRWSTDDFGNFTAAQNITAYSDIRYKTNIRTIENALDKTMKLRGVSYDRNGVPGIGVIAQEIKGVIPEVVLEGQDDEKILSVAYGNIVGLLIEAIKELKAEIDVLKKSK